MNRFIVVKLQIEGIHQWIDASEHEPQSAFLEYPHRHMFYIEAKKRISHNNREIEFIKLKHDILDFIDYEYRSKMYDSNGIPINRMIFFGNKSCEMIAEDIFNRFDLESCTVFEDDENGGGVER